MFYTCNAVPSDDSDDEDDDEDDVDESEDVEVVDDDDVLDVDDDEVSLMMRRRNTDLIISLNMLIIICCYVSSPECVVWVEFRWCFERTVNTKSIFIGQFYRFYFLRLISYYLRITTNLNLLLFDE